MEKIEFKTLAPQERENYLAFHKTAYIDDLKHSEEVVLKFPRWTSQKAIYFLDSFAKPYIKIVEELMK